MQLIRFGDKGFEKPGVIIDGVRKDLSDYYPDWDREFFNTDGLRRLHATITRFGDELPDVSPDVRWGAPIPRPGKSLCIGLNYSAHAAEFDREPPEEPVLFMKAGTAFSGPDDPIIIPKGSKQTDYEIELGIVVGRDACYLETEDEAADVVAGYVISNDVSEREFQKEHCGQWCKGKSCDSFHPVGPILVTPDEIGNINDLSLKLTVNGEVRQLSNTSDMIFKPYFLVKYLSQFMTLEAGDLVSTGTPPGVAMGMNPPKYLKPGDVVKLEIDGLGQQEQHCVAWER